MKIIPVTLRKIGIRTAVPPPSRPSRAVARFVGLSVLPLCVSERVFVIENIIYRVNRSAFGGVNILEGLNDVIYQLFLVLCNHLVFLRS